MNVTNALWPLARLSPSHNQLLKSLTLTRVRSPTLPKLVGLVLPAQLRPAPGGEVQVELGDRIRPVVGDRDRVVVEGGPEGYGRAAVAGARHDAGLAVINSDPQVGTRHCITSRSPKTPSVRRVKSVFVIRIDADVRAYAPDKAHQLMPCVSAFEAFRKRI